MRYCTHNCVVYHYGPSSIPQNKWKIYCHIAQFAITHLIVPVLQCHPTPPTPAQSKKMKQNEFLGKLKTAYSAFYLFYSVVLFQQTFFFFLGREKRASEPARWFRESKKAAGLWGWWEYSSYSMFQVCWLTNIWFFTLFLRGICSVCLFRQTLGLRPWWKWTGSGTSCFGSVCHKDGH